VSTFAGALIAGGASTRFGQDKASLPWADGSLAGHLLREMRAAGLEPLILNAARSVADLPQGVRCLPDAQTGQGPLGGLATVLRGAVSPVLVAACDMPGLDSHAFRALVSAWQPGMRGLVAKGEDGWHPLLGIYGSALLPDIERSLAQGQRALHRFIEAQALTAWVPAEKAWLANVNTAEEWEAWKAWRAE
jgi:molybdopterin-guanine dinucleotide biosynthesis protein A